MPRKKTDVERWRFVIRQLDYSARLSAKIRENAVARLREAEEKARGRKKAA